MATRNKEEQRKRLQDALNQRLEKIRLVRDPDNPGFWKEGDVNGKEATWLKALYNRVNKYGMSDKEKKQYDSYLKRAEKYYDKRNVRVKGKKNLHQIYGQADRISDNINKAALRQGEFQEELRYLPSNRKIDAISDRYSDNVTRTLGSPYEDHYHGRNFNDPLTQARLKEYYYRPVKKDVYMGMTKGNING